MDSHSKNEAEGILRRIGIVSSCHMLTADGNGGMPRT